MKKHLTNTDEKSNKFWAIETSGNAFTVTFGKIGTAGTSQTKTWESEEKCQKEAEKLLAEKLKKGYQENGNQKNLLKTKINAFNFALEQKLKESDYYDYEDNNLFRIEIGDPSNDSAISEFIKLVPISIPEELISFYKASGALFLNEYGQRYRLVINPIEQNLEFFNQKILKSFGLIDCIICYTFSGKNIFSNEDAEILNKINEEIIAIGFYQLNMNGEYYFICFDARKKFEVIKINYEQDIVNNLITILKDDCRFSESLDGILINVIDTFTSNNYNEHVVDLYS